MERNRTARHRVTSSQKQAVIRTSSQSVEHKGAKRAKVVLTIERKIAEEKLRQTREQFDQEKRHADQWVRLGLMRGYCSILCLPAVIVVCYAFGRKDLPPQTIAVVVGLLIVAWKSTFAHRGLSESGFLRHLAQVLTTGWRKSEKKDATKD